MARILTPKRVIKGTAKGPCQNCQQDTELEFELDESVIPNVMDSRINDKLNILSNKLSMSKNDILRKAIRHFESSLECKECRNIALSS